MNRTLPLIASAVYLEPWLVRPDTHALLAAQLRDALAAGDPVGPKRVDQQGNVRYDHPQVQVSEGIAYLTVSGIIGKRLSGLEMMCGGYDIGLMQQQLANIRDDPSIRALIIEFDTPGGRAQGVEDAAQSIREVADSGKRVIGYTETQACSAGYFLAAACDQFFAHTDAQVGSISTICAGVDTSRAWEMEGLELKLVATGPLKAIGQPGKRWTDEEMQFLRDRADVIDRVFKNFCATRRGLSPAAMNGGFWYARQCPEKLHDGLARNLTAVIEHTLASLAAA